MQNIFIYLIITRRKRNTKHSALRCAAEGTATAAELLGGGRSAALVLKTRNDTWVYGLVERFSCRFVSNFQIVVLFYACNADLHADGQGKKLPRTASITALNSEEDPSFSSSPNERAFAILSY